MLPFSKTARHIPLLLAALLLLPGCTREMKEKHFLSKGDSFYNQGKLDEARIEYMNALRLDYKNAEICRKIGDIWLKEGDIVQALRFLAAAGQADPNNIAAHSQLGDTYLSVGDMAAARKEALAVLKLDPTNGEALLRLANCARTPQEVSDAAKQVSDFADHNSAFYHLANGVILFLNRQPDAGQKEIEAAAAADPKSFQAHAALGDLDEVRKDSAGAAREFQTVATLAPAGSPALLRYPQFLLETGSVDAAVAALTDLIKEHPEYMPPAILEAQIDFSEKKPDDAMKLVSDVLTHDPSNLDAHLLRAQIYLSRRDAKSAVADLQNIPSPFSDLPIVKYQLAQAFMQNGDPQSASEALKQAIAASPGYVDAMVMQSGIDLNAGRAQSVIEPMQRVLQMQPTNNQARLLLAGAFRVLKRYDDAIALYRELIIADPQNSQASFFIGMTEREKGDTAAARDAFENAQRLQPNDIMSTYQLVDLDVAANDFAAAIKRVQDQHAFDFNVAAGQYLQGKIYAAQKDWPHATAAFKTAITANPKLQLAVEGLVNVYLAQGQFPLAIDQISAMLKADPKNPGALSLLAELYTHTNQVPLEQQTYEQLLQIDPTNVAALNNLAYIYQLQDGKLDQARAMADKAHSVVPDNAGIEDTLGWIELKQGKYTSGFNLIQDSVSKTPPSNEMQYHLGMANYDMGRPDAALAAFKQSAAIQGDDFPGKSSIAAKIALLEKGGYANASTDEIEAALKAQPNDPYALSSLGDAWMRQGDTAKAADAYQKAIEMNPDLPAANFGLAALYAGPLKDITKAEDYAQKARQLAPNDSRIDGIIGRIDYGKGQYAQAYDLLNQVVTSATSDQAIAPEIDELAWSAYSQGRIAEARTDMQRVAAAAPAKSTEAADAQIFLSLTDSSAQSEDAATKTLQQTPDFAPALMIDGQSREAKNDSPGAEKDFAALLKRFPDFPPAQRELARLYLDDPANKSDAYDLAMKAHTTMPDDLAAAEVLAAASYARKEYAYAVQLLQDTATKGALDPDSSFYLGMSLVQTGQKSAGHDALQQAVSSGLKEPRLSEAKKALAPEKK
jgi:tetratricopeptide (TPR) repeat protein